MKRTPILALVLAVLAAPATAAADDDEARVRASCAGAEIRLRLDAEERRTIEIELRVDARRAGRTFRIVLLHERTLVLKGLRRTTSSGSLRIRTSVDDWPGRETVTARVGTPSGRTCVIAATI